MRNFPIDPHYENRPPLNRHDVTKVGDFYNWGLWGNFSFFVSGYIKNVDAHTERFS